MQVSNMAAFPTLRAGFGLDFDPHDAIANQTVCVALCCVTEVFRSAYENAAVYAAHCASNARARCAEIATLSASRRTAGIDAAPLVVARLEEPTVRDLLCALHCQVAHANGAVAMLKPLFAHIAANGSLPDDATAIVPLQWMRRVMDHYDGTLPYTSGARSSADFHRVLFSVMMTGQTATQLSRSAYEQTHYDDADDDNDSTDAGDLDQDNDADVDQGCGVCQCAVCTAIESTEQMWSTWQPADEFDAKMKTTVEEIGASLRDICDEMQQDDDDGADDSISDEHAEQ